MQLTPSLSGLLLITSIATEATAQVWLQLSSGGPAPRYSHAMAYDRGRGFAVLFGGISGNRIGDTFEWSGNSWTPRPVIGPIPRNGHAMVYDSQRGVTVLFGGIDLTYYGDTWEWNGTTWTPRSTTGPSPRHSHAMAYDSQRGVTVLFGGLNNNGRLGDTWEWNGNSWTPCLTTGPSPRVSHAMTFDTNRRVSVLFGGQDVGSSLGDTWEWDGISWIQKAAAGPVPRSGHAMTFDSQQGVSIVHGGYGSSYLGDTWEWNGISWLQKTTSGPSPRSSHAMAYDSQRGLAVLFGGAGAASILADTWQLLTTPAASVASFGSGCQGSNGVPRLAPLPNSVPKLGTTFVLSLTQLPPVATVCVPFIGFSNTSLGTTPLPASLAPYGMPGCTILSDVFASYFIIGLGGSGSWPIGVPLSASYVGSHLFLQSLVFDPLAPNIAGIVITNGLDATIGV